MLKKLVRCIGEPGAQSDRCLSLKASNEVLEHFASTAHRYRTLTPRALERVAIARLDATKEEWEEHCERQLVSGAVNPEFKPPLPAKLPLFQIDKASLQPIIHLAGRGRRAGTITCSDGCS
jgi:hypothetical protein